MKVNRLHRLFIRVVSSKSMSHYGQMHDLASDEGSNEDAIIHESEGEFAQNRLFG